MEQIIFFFFVQIGWSILLFLLSQACNRTAWCFSRVPTPIHLNYSWPLYYRTIICFKKVLQWIPYECDNCIFDFFHKVLSKEQFWLWARQKIRAEKTNELSVFIARFNRTFTKGILELLSRLWLNSSSLHNLIIQINSTRRYTLKSRTRRATNKRVHVMGVREHLLTRWQPRAFCLFWL